MGGSPLSASLQKEAFAEMEANCLNHQKSSQNLCITAAEVMRLTSSLMNEARLEGNRLRVFHAPRALPLLGWTLS